MRRGTRHISLEDPSKKDKIKEQIQLAACAEDRGVRLSCILLAEVGYACETAIGFSQTRLRHA